MNSKIKIGIITTVVILGCLLNFKHLPTGKGKSLSLNMLNAIAQEDEEAVNKNNPVNIKVIIVVGSYRPSSGISHAAYSALSNYTDDESDVDDLNHGQDFNNDGKLDVITIRLGNWGKVYDKELESKSLTESEKHGIGLDVGLAERRAQGTYDTEIYRNTSVQSITCEWCGIFDGNCQCNKYYERLVYTIL